MQKNLCYSNLMNFNHKKITTAKLLRLLNSKTWMHLSATLWVFRCSAPHEGKI